MKTTTFKISSVGAGLILLALMVGSQLSAQTINIGPNQYAFRFTQNQNYGLFFNSTDVAYDFRNGSANAVWSINANNGQLRNDLQFAPGFTVRVPAGAWAARSATAPNAGIFFGNSDFEFRIANGSPGWSMNATTGNSTFAGTVSAQGGSSTQWNQAHTWGNHATAGYIATESDPKIATDMLVSSVPRWSGSQLVASSISATTATATIKGSPAILGNNALLTLENPGGAGLQTSESRMQFVKATTQVGSISTAGNNFRVQAVAGDLLLRTGNTDRLTINANGNVGIGTAPNSTARLAVNGQVLATQVRVLALANWPDYVFAEGYELMSLDDLAGYIKSEKHLPGIPAAHEMESAESLDLGEMQRLTIEKVEELTLYILELKAESDRLKAENEAFKLRFESLENK